MFSLNGGKWIYPSKRVLLLMAHVRVRFFGVLREMVGRREEGLQIDDASNLVDLIELLSSKHGKKFTDFVFDQGKLRDGFAFAINGDSLSESKLSSTKCKNVREFVILPPISGG
ncbi:MAG: MoaD/ThiS family protein [Nitrososphaerales archaeon]